MGYIHEHNGMPLFDDLPPRDFSRVRFDGETIDHAKDQKRLVGQLARVHDALQTGEWFTLRQLADIAGGSEAGVSARIRDLRKEHIAGLEIVKRRVGEGRGTWEYRLEAGQ